jgi:hypothetical protein
MRAASDACATDIAFFGVLRAVYGFDTFKDIMANTTLQPWCGTRCGRAKRAAEAAPRRYARMAEEVGGSSRLAPAV